MRRSVYFYHVSTKGTSIEASSIHVQRVGICMHWCCCLCFGVYGCSKFVKMQTLQAQHIAHILQFVQQQDAHFYKEKQLKIQHLFGKKQGVCFFLFPSLILKFGELRIPKNYSNLLANVQYASFFIKEHNYSRVTDKLLANVATTRMSSVELDNLVQYENTNVKHLAQLFKGNISKVVAKLFHGDARCKELVTAALAVPTLKHLELRLAPYDELPKSLQFYLPMVETMILENALFQFDAPLVKNLVLYGCDLAKFMQLSLVGNLEHLEMYDCKNAPDMVQIQQSLTKLKYMRLNNSSTFVKCDKWNAVCDLADNIDDASTATCAILQADSKPNLKSYPCYPLGHCCSIGFSQSN